jgi:6,7-dimethyl-8-ribityllumazine synthase
MIESVWISYVAKSIEDFDALVRLLEAIGIRTSHSADQKDKKFAAFYPPVARFDLIGHRTSKQVFHDPDLWISHSDPMSAFEIVKKLGFKVISDVSGRSLPVRSFRLELPAGTSVTIGGPTLGGGPEPDDTDLVGSLNAADKRFGVVVSRFNAFITERLFQGAMDGLVRCGAKRKDIGIVRVTGAFEIPLAARTLAETKKYDAIICIGCLLRGGTAHYDVIVNEVTRGIGQSAQETGVPHAFGVLTCDTLEQAIDRAGLKMGNKGFEAALAAVEMANLKRAVSRQPSAVRKAGLRSQVSGVRNGKSKSAKKSRR